METQQVWPVANPITIRASAVLAATWDATPTEVATAGVEHITFYITYTRGLAGGAFDFQVQVSPYAATVAAVENWFTTPLYAAGTLAAGADVQSRLQCEYITYASTSGAAQIPPYGPLALHRTVERLRVLCRESGQPNSPGIVHIVAVAV